MVNAESVGSLLLEYDKLVAFSCKRRGFCPSCSARRMSETAALLVDDILPQKPVRQKVFTLQTPTAHRPGAMV